MKYFLGLLSLFFCHSTIAQDRVSGKLFATRSVAMAQNGMAATSHPLTTIVALGILKKGGSAVDAAIAVNALYGLVDPGDGGPGGDLFAIVWDDASQQLYGLNGRGRSARALTVEKMHEEMDKGNRHWTGALSVTVPGAVDGWFSLHERFGKLSMQDVLRPTIK